MYKWSNKALFKAAKKRMYTYERLLTGKLHPKLKKKYLIKLEIAYKQIMDLKNKI